MKKQLLLFSFLLISFCSFSQDLEATADFVKCENEEANFTYEEIQDFAILEFSLGEEFDLFETIEDASNETDFISTDTEFTVLSSEEEAIYVKETGSIYEVKLKTIALPTFDYPGITICDDEDGDDYNTFPLNVESALLSSDDLYTYTFHQTEQNASANETELPNSFHTVDTNIFIRLEGEEGCFSVYDFPLKSVFCGEDADGDGVPNGEEDINENGNLETDDTDGDGIPNYQDLDDDGDGILTIDEDYNGNGDPTDDDLNENEIPDYLEADFSVLDFTYEMFECEDILTVFAVIEVEEDLIDAFNLQSLQIFESLEDLDNDENEYTSEYISLEFDELKEIYVKGITLASEEITIKVSLKKSENPSIEHPGLTVCMDDNDDIYTSYDLYLEEDFIPEDYPFELKYYSMEIDAEAEVNQLQSPHVDIFEEIIYLRLENPETNCYSIYEFPLKSIDCDQDEDNDGIVNGSEDVNENGNLETDDTDGDGIPNYADADDDGDGILTIDEDYNENGDPTDDDTNENDIPDYLEADVALSVNEISILEKISIYPNPSNGILKIKSNSKIINSVIISDTSGLVLLQIENFNTSGTLNLSEYENGIYLVKLTLDNYSIVERVQLY
ncbi:T9SS type A sorting domain-containing protein [Aureivirga sp. CE67]|uniref:T9SS type A sorting domain-containing protein n=1 Tax=Aureivirga sp. CE67 TaxID=1788983 RepID=UPI0018CB760F|nr:T9SS type A sorting domain-containing protein [Aureivirga sp. CE67]